MDQVSRPLLIVLAATIALVAIWLVALKPKPVAVENTPLSPTTVIPKATQAADAAKAANAKLQAAADASEGTAAAPGAARTAAPAKPVAASKPSAAVKPKVVTSREAGILRALRTKKVVVILFWSAQGADDIATRGALGQLDRRNGKVGVHIVPIGEVGKYGAITRGVQVVQSPTTIVIGRNRRARVITGLTESHELRQAVGDAFAGR